MAGSPRFAACSTRSSGSEEPSRKEKAEATRSSAYGRGPAWRGSSLASRRFNNSLRAPAATMSDASEGPTSREGTPRLREGLSEGLLEDRRCFSLTPPTLWRKKGVSQCGRGHPTHEISHLS